MVFSVADTHPLCNDYDIHSGFVLVHYSMVIYRLVLLYMMVFNPMFACIPELARCENDYDRIRELLTYSRGFIPYEDLKKKG